MRVKILGKHKKMWAEIGNAEAVITYKDGEMMFYFRRTGPAEYSPMTETEVGKLILYMKENSIKNQQELTLQDIDFALDKIRPSVSEEAVKRAVARQRKLRGE